MKKRNILGLSFISIVALTACGGGGSSSSPSSKTGKAFYLDSAVSGVNYRCGNQEGITGTDGSFTFEEGKSCTFYLGHIKLRDMGKAQLKEGSKIVEEDIKIASLLQTLDVDGNPANGITITKEVVDAMEISLSENGGDGTLPDTATELEILVASLEHVAGYSGQAVRQSDAQSHLDATKTAVETEATKVLLAGKTFYVVGEEGDDNTLELFKFVVNKEATSFTTFKLDGTKTDTGPINIVGNKVIIGDNDGSYMLISQENGYILADDHQTDGSKDGIGHRLYASQSDAQAYFDSVKAEMPFNLSALVGKTLYQHVQYNGQTGISEITLQADGKLKLIDFDKIEFLSYRIVKNTLYVIEEGQEKAHTLVEHTDKYVKFSDADSETSTFYFTKSDAEFAPIQEIDEGSDTVSIPTQFTKEWLNGRTLYNSYEDDGQWSLVKFTFTDTTMHGEDDSNSDDTIDVDYTITEEGYISAQKPAEWNEGTGSFNIGVAESTDEYLKVCWTSPENIGSCLEHGGEEEYFFFDYQNAKKFIKQKNKDIKEVQFNGKVIFKNQDGNIIAKPNNAKIAIRPASNIWSPKIEIEINNDGTFSKMAKVSKKLFEVDSSFTLVVYGDVNNNNNWDGDSGEINNNGVLENDIRYFDKNNVTFDDLNSIEVIVN